MSSASLFLVFLNENIHLKRLIQKINNFQPDFVGITSEIIRSQSPLPVVIVPSVPPLVAVPNEPSPAVVVSSISTCTGLVGNAVSCVVVIVVVPTAAAFVGNATACVVTASDSVGDAVAWLIVVWMSLDCTVDKTVFVVVDVITGEIAIFCPRVVVFGVVFRLVL